MNQRMIDALPSPPDSSVSVISVKPNTQSNDTFLAAMEQRMLDTFSQNIKRFAHLPTQDALINEYKLSGSSGKKMLSRKSNAKFANPVLGLTRPSVHRLCRRGGVKRISADIGLASFELERQNKIERNIEVLEQLGLLGAGDQMRKEVENTADKKKERTADKKKERKAPKQQVDLDDLDRMITVRRERYEPVWKKVTEEPPFIGKDKEHCCAKNCIIETCIIETLEAHRILVGHFRITDRKEIEAVLCSHCEKGVHPCCDGKLKTMTMSEIHDDNFEFYCCYDCEMHAIKGHSCQYKPGTVALREIRTQQRRTDKSSVPRNCTQME
tara:strand:- start:224 stop:1201 length:978 start_codon:yes stop_codon:yes gene_type:complete